MIGERSALWQCLYQGPVTHRRYVPVRHALRYNVFSVFVDVDQLATLGSANWLIGYNRTRFLSIQDTDHGAGTHTPISRHVWHLVRQHPEISVSRIFMFCFPRILGRLFNPLTAYIAVDAQDQPAIMIYEVSNTFGQRHSYVVPVSKDGLHSVEKQFFVSPYNDVAGEYRFRLHRIGESLRLDIAYFLNQKLQLSARIEGERRALTTREIFKAAWVLAIQPAKVWGGIHWEALKLYIKGLRPKRRPEHAAFAVSGAELSKPKAALPVEAAAQYQSVQFHPNLQ